MNKKLYITDDSANRLYSHQNLKWKPNEKERLQKLLWLKVDKKKFVIWNVISLTDKNCTVELLKSVEWLLELWIQFIMTTSAEEKYQWPIEALIEKFPWQIVLSNDTEEWIRDIFAIADIWIFLSFEEGLISSAMSYGCIPVCINSNNNQIIQNFNPLLEKWNAFVFDKASQWNIFEAVIRARESYKFPYDWENLKLQCTK